MILIDYENLDSINFFSENIFKSVEPTYLDTNEGKILSSAIYLKIKNDKYYILDKAEPAVVVFDHNGKCVIKLSKTGRGPGEYTSIRDFNITNDGNIEVLSPMSKVIRYSPTGELISEIDLKFSAYSFIQQNNDSYLFFCGRKKDSVMVNNTIVTTNRNFDYIKSSLPMTEFLLATYDEMNFSASTDSSILFKHVYDNNIYKIYPNTITPALKINFGSKTYPQELFHVSSFSQAYDIVMKITAAYTRVAFENLDYLLLYIAEEGVDNNMSYLLINKNSGRTYYQKFPLKSSVIACFGAPVALTDKNEIIFIAEPVLLNELCNKYNILSKLDKSKLGSNAGYVLLKFKLSK